mgnify:CR=1 FL=1
MKILIVEDESRIARYLEKLTREILADRLASLNIASNIKQAKNFLQDNAIDLLLLDLNLEGEDGFKLLENIVAGSFHTIIVSAYKEKALKAFEYGVLDFVPKPFSRERLHQAFFRALDNSKSAAVAAKYLAIKKQGRIRLIDVQQILYIKGARSYSEVYLASGQSVLHDKSLNKLDAILPESFVRIHKSYIVKMSAVKNILVHSGTRYEVVLNDTIKLPIGRTKYKELKALWG